MSRKKCSNCGCEEFNVYTKDSVLLTKEDKPAKNLTLATTVLLICIKCRMVNDENE